MTGGSPIQGVLHVPGTLPESLLPWDKKGQVVDSKNTLCNIPQHDFGGTRMLFWTYSPFALLPPKLLHEEAHLTPTPPPNPPLHPPTPAEKFRRAAARARRSWSCCCAGDARGSQRPPPRPPADGPKLTRGQLLVAMVCRYFRVP